MEMSQSFPFTNLSRSDKTVVQFWLHTNCRGTYLCYWCVCVHIIIWHCVMTVQPVFTANKDCILSPRRFPSQQSQVQLMAINHWCVTKPQNSENRGAFFFPQISRALLVSYEFQDLWLKMVAITFSLISSLWQYLIGEGLQIKCVMACAVANYLSHLLPSRIL